MIVVDTSALMAIYLREPEAEAFAMCIARSTRALVAAPTAFEFRLVAIKKKGIADVGIADALLARSPIEVVAWGPEHIEAATAALLRFGKNYHPASLNFGDCTAYALAQVAKAPLLYKSNDFAQTDIASALD